MKDEPEYVRIKRRLQRLEGEQRELRANLRGEFGELTGVPVDPATHSAIVKQRNVNRREIDDAQIALAFVRNRHRRNVRQWTDGASNILRRLMAELPASDVHVTKHVGTWLLWCGGAVINGVPVAKPAMASFQRAFRRRERLAKLERKRLHTRESA